MALLGGLVGKLLALVLLLVVLAVAVGVFAYSTDYGVESTVSTKDCSASPPLVTVMTKMGGFTETVAVSYNECFIIQLGYFVIYHIRTERTVIYEKEDGRCVYDTAGLVC